jgi:hypothetical protein
VLPDFAMPGAATETPLKRRGTEEAEEFENRVIGRSGDLVIGKQNLVSRLGQI